MSSSIIGKYSVPAITSAAVKRARIVTLIHSLSTRGVLFIHAPAGYGKTTAVAQWIAAKGLKTAWLSVDEYDNTESDFCHGLMQSFLTFSQNGSKDIGLSDYTEAILKDISPNKLTFQKMMLFLSSYNFDDGPTAIVIDDFQIFECEEIQTFLPVLRNRLPINLRVIILSRNEPSDMLREYILKDMLRQIHADELLFTAEEVSKLYLRQGFKISKYETEKICKHTLGWPIALTALTLTEKNGKSCFSVDEEDTWREYLCSCIRYQINEFWKGTHREIILKSSICDVINVSLCEVIFTDKSAWQTLMRFARKTGLLMRDNGDNYCFQKLVKDFLRTEFEKDESIDKNAVYHKVGIWYKECGYTAEAIEIAAKNMNIELIENAVRIHAWRSGRENMGQLNSYSKSN